jgi:hypothetical protein
MPASSNSRIKAPVLRGVALAAFVALSAIVGTRGWAHHSFAMFDQNKRTVLAGTVREFQWTNPHVWIQLAVPDGKGGSTEWSIECTSVNFMVRRGWRHDTLKPGDKITLTMRPLKDGSHGGSLVAVTSVNGGPLSLSPE